MKEILAAFMMIDLTEEEMDEAILWAKRKKKNKLEEEERRERERKNRELLTDKKWTLDMTTSFMMYRASKMFEKPFVLDEKNSIVFGLLCRYFSSSDDFLAVAKSIGVQNPSLDKGILLAGNFGVGKTWLMKLFSKNQRQVFHIHNAKMIADAFEANGQKELEEGMDYIKKIKNPTNDADSFYQPYAGICIDDMGTEEEKSHYGNKKNVIGDLIEKRYAKGNCGVFFHATTNLTAKQLGEFYGGRVLSRFKEIFNFIELPGKDRRV